MQIPMISALLTMASAVSVLAAQESCVEAEARLVDLGQFETSDDRAARLSSVGYIWAIMAESIEDETTMAAWHFEAFLMADQLMYDCWRGDLVATGLVTEEDVDEMLDLRSRYRDYAEERL